LDFFEELESDSVVGQAVADFGTKKRDLISFVLLYAVDVFLARFDFTGFCVDKRW